ncbi:MAG: hypothetical protein ACI8R4_003750 [Paracoccaceae bacterium]|jgi:hypothetical protein
MSDMTLTAAQADFLKQFLGIDIPTATSAADEPAAAAVSIVKLGKARLEWATHKKRMFAEINRLKNAVQKVYQSAPDMQGAVTGGLAKLDVALSQFSDDLADQLDAVLNEGDPDQRQKLSGKAAKTAAGFLAYCEADPVVAAIDGNEFLPDMNIVGAARARLQKITAALGQ